MDADAGLLLPFDVPGTPLRDAALASDEDACRGAGSTLGSWHAAWAERVLHALPVHMIGDELAALVDLASIAPRAIRLHVRTRSGIR